MRAWKTTAAFASMVGNGALSLDPSTLEVSFPSAMLVDGGSGNDHWGESRRGDGTGLTLARGEAWITPPDWFGALNQDYRCQLTCLGDFVPAHSVHLCVGALTS